jgi:hypothetical protein
MISGFSSRHFLNIVFGYSANVTVHIILYSTMMIDQLSRLTSLKFKLNKNSKLGVGNKP